MFTLFEDAEDQVVFFDGLNTDGIHAVLAAQVASIEPIALDVLVFGDIAAQKVPMTVVFKMLGSCLLKFNTKCQFQSMN